MFRCKLAAEVEDKEAKPDAARSLPSSLPPIHLSGPTSVNLHIPKLTPFPLFPSTRLLTFLGICQKPSVVPDPTDDQVNDSALMDFTVSRKRL